MAAPNVAGGCNLDASYGGIANANCICTSNLGCVYERTVDVSGMDSLHLIQISTSVFACETQMDGSARCNSGQCAVNLVIENVREMPNGQSFKDSLVQGDNTVVTF